MLPLIAALAKAGLGLIGDAVLAKGKEVVEQKLGVNLDEALSTPQGRVDLMRLQIEREKELQEFALAKAEQDLKSDAMFLADTQSARGRDVEFLKAGTRNYRADGMFVLAVFVVVWLVYIVWKDQSTNEYVKGIFTLVLGRFLGYIDSIYNFEFGTTRNNRTKDVSIENLTRRKDQ